MPVRSLNLISLMTALLLLAGCGTQASHQVVSNATTGMSGKIRGGQQPVVGATIQLYAVGTGGDGSASTALLATPVTTDANGNFFVPATAYSCTNATQVYLLATGGNPGTTQANPSLALMAALGPCTSLSSLPLIVVNELTTVAGVSALYPYMTSPTAMGSGSNDAAALATAFELSSEFVNPATGTAPGLNVPSGLTVPIAEINTLSDIVATCINSIGGTAGDNTNCGNLFNLTTPPTLATPPTNTVTALLNLADNPTLNTPSLYAMTTPTGPFQPTLSVAPPDFRIRLTSSSGGGSGTVLQITPSSIAFPNTPVGTASAAQPVTITNSGSTAITLNSIAITGTNAGDFSQTNDCGSSLAPAAVCTVQVTASPSANGMRNAYLGVNSSSPDSPQYVALSVTGVALDSGPVTLSPSTLSFTIGGTLQDVTLSNFGSTPLVIQSITTTLVNNGGTSLSPTYSVGNTTCGSTLPAQSVCTISVASLGGVALNGQTATSTGTLTVVDNAAGGPQTVALTATNASAFVDPNFNNWSGVISFPADQVGYQQTQSGYSYQATTHNGTPALSLSLSGSDPSDFSYTVSQSGSIITSGCFVPPLGQACDLSFSFTPGAAGTRTAQAVVTQQPYQYILLTGTGVGPGPAFRMGSSSISLSNSLPSAPDPNSNAQASAPLTITNIGTTTFGFSASFTGPNAALMTASAGNCASVAPQASCTATIGFNSTNVGNFTASLIVKDANSTFTQSIPITANTAYWNVIASPGSLQFGQQALGTTSAAQTFTLADQYGYPLGHPLSVTLQSSSNFVLTQGSTCTASLTQVCTLAIAFKPFQTGFIYETATATDQVSGDTYHIQLSGTGGVPVVSLSASSLQFPARASGTTSIPMSVTLTNTGAATLTINNISILGAVNGNFTQTNNCPSTVAVNGTCTINVTFAPTTTGAQTAAVQILSNAASSPDSVALSGTAN
jgi:trimeric autotransporter adhesin